MALQLTRNAARDFSGKAGKEVLLGITAAGGAPASILVTNYNEVAQNAAPFKIKLGKGDHGLVVVFASTEGTKVSIQEVDIANPATTQVLAQTTFHKADPSVTILIRVP